MTKEVEKNGIKYLNINVSNSEVERNPDIVRLCSDAGTLEYAKLKRPMQLWEAYLLLNNPETAYTKEELEEAKRLVSVENEVKE